MSAKLTSKHPPEDEAVHNPDDIINELGGCGNFQIRMAIIVHVIKTIVNWATISMVFLTAVPEWRCRDDGYFNTSTNENSTRSNNISLEKSCVNLKGEKCLSFEFNEDMHTVVSEVSH